MIRPIMTDAMAAVLAPGGATVDRSACRRVVLLLAPEAEAYHGT
jgi:hypothetical protein